MVLNYHIDGGDFVNAGKASSAVKNAAIFAAVPVVNPKAIYQNPTT